MEGIAELSQYSLIIAASVVLIFSFFFGEISKRTSIPSVLLLIVLGIVAKLGLEAAGINIADGLDEYLKILGTIGLIMIVLEAALELKLDQDQIVPIIKALVIALVGLVGSAVVTAFILMYMVDGFQEGNEFLHALYYATPISILSSAIIIPSVIDLKKEKKEFHIYESTFSDILGIMMFYFLEGILKPSDINGHGSAGNPVVNFAGSTLLTIIIAIISSYLIVIVFQKIKTSVKLFLLIAVLLLIYAIGKQFHLSSLLFILIFGLVISNMDLSFRGRLNRFLDKEAAHDIYHGLHVITMETAFVVRTFFFVIFGITITFDALADWNVVGISALCLLTIYAIRFVLLRASIGKDIVPQLYIAPRGLITILLFNAIYDKLVVKEFSEGILLFIIIGTSIVMTIAMIWDKRRTNGAINAVKQTPVRTVKWKIPDNK